MEYVDRCGAFLDFVNDPVHVGLPAIQQVTKCLIFWGGWRTVWVLFEAIDSFRQAVEPTQGLVVVARLNSLINAC